jgi:hypothetical protein
VGWGKGVVGLGWRLGVGEDTIQSCKTVYPSVGPSEALTPSGAQHRDWDNPGPASEATEGATLAAKAEDVRCGHGGPTSS